MSEPRRLPVGAEVQSHGVHFRVWAPQRKQVEVVLDKRAHALQKEATGYFSATVPTASHGMRYRYRLDGGDAYPDPASRFQPDGPHGPSEIVDPSRYRWTDSAWRGVPLEGQVVYEMHIGTFTEAGTWEAAERELPRLADLGVTVLEVMPVADFPGTFGWGYDGVNLFAPTRLYGSPDQFRHFVDAAHVRGLAVILDVVYNHIGPDGNYLRCFAPAYFSAKKNEWGDALNFDGPDSEPVREFFVANAGYWIDEYHLDGLRLDATQSIFDDSPEHFLTALGRRVREKASGRITLIVAENEPQHARLVRPIDAGGYGLDALWNDDFHHSAMVALTGHNEAYYSDYRGTPQELVNAVKWGFLFQGQRSGWQKKPRGMPALDVPPARFVTFLQNHDQVANSGDGKRLQRLASPGRFRALTALFLLAPGTPMLFQGQEFDASTPFLFFADHKPELTALVRKGRAEFLKQFASLALPAAQANLDDCGARDTFLRCKLKSAECDPDSPTYRLHRDLLRLRRSDPVFSDQRLRGVDGTVLGEQAFALRFFGAEDRLMLVNLGRDLQFGVVSDPLLAPPQEQAWRLLWSSNAIRYGGIETPAVVDDAGWHVPGEAAVVLGTPEGSQPLAGG